PRRARIPAGQHTPPPWHIRRELRLVPIRQRASLGLLAAPKGSTPSLIMVQRSSRSIEEQRRLGRGVSGRSRLCGCNDRTYEADSLAEEERFEPSVPPKRDDDAARILEGKMPETSNGDFEKRYLLRGNRG